MFQIKIADQNLTMEKLMEKEDFSGVLLKLGQLVEGTIVSKAKNKIVVDLGGSLMGVILGKELHDSLDTAKSLKVGDQVSTVIVEEENEDGMLILSLRKASQIHAWDRFEKAHKEGTTLQAVAQEANKGGLLLDIDGIKAFIPVSQLAPLHYPRVDNADLSQILSKLQALIGQKFNVKVITVDREAGKLIFSEKEAMTDNRSSALSHLKRGQKVKGVISGVVKFGIFVTFDGLEGLVHISEIAWGHVKDPNEYGKVGDNVDVLVIGVDGEKISLSIKRLIPDPWLEVAKKFKIGKEVECAVNKVTKFGAFVTLGEEINGLIHISEIAHEKISDPKDYLTVGQKITARVISVDLDEHRIGLSIKALLPEPEKKEIKKEGEEMTEVKEVKTGEKAEKTEKKAKKVEKQVEAEGEEKPKKSKVKEEKAGEEKAETKKKSVKKEE